MNDRTKTISLAAVVLIGMIATVVLARFVDARRPPVDVAVNDESLYLNAKTATRVSLGFNALAGAMPVLVSPTFWPALRFPHQVGTELDAAFKVPIGV